MVLGQLVVSILSLFAYFQIPCFVRDSLEHTSTPLDGITLTEQMHQRGINMRYLGKLADRLVQVPQLDYLLTIVLSEILVRSAKHVFQAYLQVERALRGHLPSETSIARGQTRFLE